MRVTDYIASFIASNLECKHVFLVTGGGMMFLSDGLCLEKRLTPVCMHHEQAAAMAATGYAKTTAGFGCAMVTTGCGGTNAITGLLNAWQDGAKVFFISGQVKRKQTTRNSGLPLRQFGVQEADIVRIVEPLTKYAVMVNDPNEIAYHLEKAKYLSENGHPGPIWLDIPMDVQGAPIREAELKHFIPEQPESQNIGESLEYLKAQLKKAKRPVILAGQGIDLSHTRTEFYELLKKWQIPVVTSFLGANSISGKHLCYIGRIGTKGNRAGNLTVQNADFLLTLGCRLSVSSTGHEFNMFARAAKIMVVDIDPTVVQKNTVHVDHFCHCSLTDFFAGAASIGYKCPSEWFQKTHDWRQKYPPCMPSFADDSHGISLYYFVDQLSQALNHYPKATVVSDAGSSFYATTQTICLSDDQRYVTSGGQAEMGFSLPAAIGSAASYGKNAKVVAITGDGSLQMNIQEFQTLKFYQFPVKLFVWNNNGYLSIRATQRKFFNGRFIGTDASSGVSFPDLQKISEAYGLCYVRLEKSTDLQERITQIMEKNEPIICEVICNPDQEIIPSISSVRLPDGTMKSLPPEDMYPFLPWEEFCSEMVIKPIERK